MITRRDDLERFLADAKAQTKAARKQKSEAEARGDGDAHALALEAIDAAVDAEDRARIALAVFDATGGEHGVVAVEDRVVGSIAVELPPGTTRDQREKRIAEALGDALVAAAASADAVLAAAPVKYVSERPGRDAAGRTVLDVRGRIEGGRVLPALRPTTR